MRAAARACHQQSAAARCICSARDWQALSSGVIDAAVAGATTAVVWHVPYAAPRAQPPEAHAASLRPAAFQTDLQMVKRKEKFGAEFLRRGQGCYFDTDSRITGLITQAIHCVDLGLHYCSHCTIW